MADTHNLVNVQVVVDNIPWAIVPGSFSYIRGTGTRDTKTAVVGTNVTIVKSLNLEEAFGQFKFMVRNTETDLERIDRTIDEGQQHAVTISGTVRENNQSFTRSFNDAGIVNDPERALSPDGETELEWTGTQSV